VKDEDLNTSPNLPSSGDGLGDGTSGATPAEQARGWIAVSGESPKDDVANFTVNPWAPEPDPGFLNRPSGMER
jgi:hypothetical protein